MGLYEAGYTTPLGRVEKGFVVIEARPKRVVVTLITEEAKPKPLGKFTKSQWLDQDAVNVHLRAGGLLWRRTKTEREYRRQAK